MDLTSTLSHKDFDPVAFLRHALKPGEDHLRVCNNLSSRLQSLNMEFTATLSACTSLIITEVAYQRT